MLGSQVDFHALDIGSVVNFPPFLSLEIGTSITVSPGEQCEDELEWPVKERWVYPTSSVSMSGTGMERRSL